MNTHDLLMLILLLSPGLVLSAAIMGIFALGG
jgi:type III secretory pathway component EscS